jgi:hypothetical protein
MSLAERTSDGLAIVEVACEPRGDSQACTIAGTHMFRRSTRPLGARGNPSKVCFVEVGLSNITAHAVSGATDSLVSVEGPGGTCATQLVSTIDFASKTYTLAKSSADKTGDICGQQVDETHVYTIAAFVEPRTELRCDGVEAVPSTWFP